MAEENASGGGSRTRQEEAKWRWRWQRGWHWRGKINNYSKYKLIEDIQTQLIACGRLDEFRASCFAQFSHFDPNAYLCGKALIALLSREIIVQDAPVGERWFHIGDRSLRFSKLEFCMITGLKFGISTFDPESPDHVPPANGVYRRLYDGKSVVAHDLRTAFTRGDFRDRPDDTLKVAYVLLVSMYLFGMDGRGPIFHWLWTLVEDPVLFNSFPWGTYTFQRLCYYLDVGIRAPSTPRDVVQFHLYGFPIALQLWAYECIPTLGNICGDKISLDGIPRGVRWKCPKKSPDLNSIFNSHDVVCLQMEPTEAEMLQSYMADIEMDISQGVLHIHQDPPIGQMATVTRGQRRPRANIIHSDPPSQSMIPTRPPSQRAKRPRTATQTQLRDKINAKLTQQAQTELIDDGDKDLTELIDNRDTHLTSGTQTEVVQPGSQVADTSPRPQRDTRPSDAPVPEMSRVDLQRQRSSYRVLSARETTKFMRKEVSGLLESTIRAVLPDILREVLPDALRQCLPDALRQCLPDALRQCMLGPVRRGMHEDILHSSDPSPETGSGRVRAHQGPAGTSNFDQRDIKFPVALEQASQVRVDEDSPHIEQGPEIVVPPTVVAERAGETTLEEPSTPTASPVPVTVTDKLDTAPHTLDATVEQQSVSLFQMFLDALNVEIQFLDTMNIEK